MYASTAARIIVRGRPWTRVRPRPRSERHIFVVGAPRSGTTFLAASLGAQPGLVDLGEVKPLKAAIPELMRLPEGEAAARFRRIVELVHRLGLSGQLRGVEQTPETAFVLAAALRAYPEARAVHMLRDGRDVVCSLLERGWLSESRVGVDDAGLPYGSHLRPWVEPERTDEFLSASDATRAAWAWRRYVTAARGVHERTLEVRYEELVTDPAAAAEQLAAHLDLDASFLAEALADAHAGSVGRWRQDLTPEELAEVEREAGPLLRELGYA
jgi:hypothetical protein